MSIQIQISEDLAQGRSPQQLQHDTTEGLIINDYLNARISLGEVAEKLKIDYVDARNWLHNRGIATLRSLSPELQSFADKNRTELAKKLGIKKTNT